MSGLSAHIKVPTNLTDAGKRRVARDMIIRGVHFLGAAIFLKREGGHGYVVRHLLCQGLELLLKGILLYHDFNGYWPKLKGFSHDLMSLSSEVGRAYKVRPMSQGLTAELKVLSGWYAMHLLRYSSGLELVVDVDTIVYDKMLARTCAVLRVLRRNKVIG